MRKVNAMIKITTNTGKVYTINESTDLELIANAIHNDATSNECGCGTISVSHRSWVNTTITINVFDDETPAETLWALLNRADYIFRQSEGAMEGSAKNPFFEVFKNGFYRHFSSLKYQEWHCVDKYILYPNLFQK